MPVQLVERGWNEAIRNLGPTEYNTYPAERYALPNPGREEVLAMASRTQAQQDAYIKNALETGISRAFEGEFTKGIANNGPSADRQRFVLTRPHTAKHGDPWPFFASIGHSFRPATVSGAGLPGGSRSAHYPAAESVSRPGFQPAQLLPPDSAGKVRQPTRPTLVPNPAFAQPPPTINRPQSAPPAMMMMAANRFPSMPRASLSSSAEARTLRLLHGMQHLAIRNAPLPKVPVLRHSQRPPSYERGLSLPALKALRRFAGAVGWVDLTVDEVMGIKKPTDGKPSSPVSILQETAAEKSGDGGICALTRHTGLSIFETFKFEAERRAPTVTPVGTTGRVTLQHSACGMAVAVKTSSATGTSGLLGRATTFIQYDGSAAASMSKRGGGGAPTAADVVANAMNDAVAASEGMVPTSGGGCPKVGELLDAVIATATKLEEADMDDDTGAHFTRYYWLELTSTSSNLLAGSFHPERFDPGSSAQLARMEDPMASRQDALLHAKEAFLFGVSGGGSKPCKVVKLPSGMDLRGRMHKMMSAASEA